MVYLLLLTALLSLASSYEIISVQNTEVFVEPKKSFSIQFIIATDTTSSPSLPVVTYLKDRESSAQGFTRFWGDSQIKLNVTRNAQFITLSGTYLAPPQEGKIFPVWTVDGKEITTSVEVSCSDRIYCNGIERWVRGTCQSPPETALPCRSLNGDACSSYQCIEETKSCATTPLGGSSCPKCLPKACRPSCRGVTCGDDGCGGSCGFCNSGTYCVTGSCTAVSQIGSCVNPAPLFGTAGFLVPSGGIQDYFVYGDNSVGTLDMTTPVCGSPGIREYVYGFRVTAELGMGVEISMTCADGSTGCDTVLAIHNSACQRFTLTAVDRLCSDDQTPPGGVGSRVSGKLPVGDYTLIVTAYATSTVGPYRLKVKFHPGCYPKCESVFCGSDDCGGVCGNCTSGEACTFGRCQAVPCQPNCQTRQCGPDGCGGFCGTCKNKRVCDQAVGQCVPVKACEGFVADCPNNRQGTGPRGMFCGSDCEWHRFEDPAPDLIPSTPEQVKKSTVYFWSQFDDTSCSVAEQCVGGTGQRYLMTFDTLVHNIGNGDLIGPTIIKNPDLFIWASCHQHYHFDKFARFNLYSFDGKEVVLLGAKLAYCMEDAIRYFDGSDIVCDPQYDCLTQGIPRGRSDLYPASLDCQWLDITNVRKKCWYTYEVCTNIGRTLFESTFENNCVRFPIYVPDNVVGGSPLTLDQAMQRDNALSFYGGCAP